MSRIVHQEAVTPAGSPRAIRLHRDGGAAPGSSLLPSSRSTRTILARACLVAAVTIFPSVVRAETLADAIGTAYETNPDLLAQRAQLKAIGERYVQARAQLGFTVDGSVSLQYQHALVDSVVARGTVYNATNTTKTLSIVQPLYTGGRASAGIQSALANVFQAYQNVRVEENRVLTEVVTAYADVQRDQQLVSIGEENITLLQGQVTETGAKLAVRESTLTDRDQGEARITQARAQVAIARARLDASRAAYRALVGHDPGMLADPPVLPPLATTREEAQAAAEDSSPQLLGAEFQERASRANIATARGQGIPSVVLRGDANEGPLVGYDQRLRDNYQSVRVVVSVPIFSSGMVTSRVREARARNDSDVNQVESARRQVNRNIAQAWDQLAADLAATTLYDQQVAALSGVYKGTKIEERFALRTTLDILNAAQELNSARINRASAVHDAYVQRATLLAAAGRLEPVVFGVATNASLPPDIRALNHRDVIPWIPAVKAIDSIGQPRELSKLRP